MSSRLKIGKSGQVSASCFPKTNITNLVCKSSTMRFSSYAWMIPLQIASQICVTTFCAGLIVWKEASRLGHVPIGGMIRYVFFFFFCGFCLLGEKRFLHDTHYLGVASNYSLC